MLVLKNEFVVFVVPEYSFKNNCEEEGYTQG